jgi:acyl-CoA reductase-like NAD-dependent aldehyde dehydrogenase
VFMAQGDRTMISAKEQFLKELPDLLWAARTLSAALDVWERGKTPNEDREKQIETAREILDSYDARPAEALVE